MHNNYFFLRRFVDEIVPLLTGGVLIDNFAVNNEDLVFVISKGDKTHYLKTICTPKLGLNLLKETYSKPKRNYRTWSKTLEGLSIKSVRIFENERAFVVNLEEYSLVFKMYGQRSNVLLYHQEQLHQVFNNRLKVDYELTLEGFDKQLDLSLEQYKGVEADVSSFLPTLGKGQLLDLKLKGFYELPVEEQHQTLLTYVEFLQADSLSVRVVNDKPELQIGEQDGAYWTGVSAIEAANEFEYLWFNTFQFQEKKRGLLTEQNRVMKKLKKEQRRLQVKLDQLPKSGARKKLADVVMANLHVFQNKPSVELFDFYANENIVVHLPEGLSPQLYAQKLYKKSKKEHIEKDNITQLFTSKQLQLDKAAALITQIEQTDNWKALRKFVKQDTGKKVLKVKQFKEFEFFGYMIFVGKNSKNNDELTLKFANKNDLWLHAKDVAGSHVVVKRKGKETVPKNVVEYAATLAGKYSKRKNDSLCPVTVTEKKFVRKVKGSPAGAVVVDKEDVILVKLN
ncbi:NFACT RNA binding domain-containing protein [Cyclobacteriaceae bacterium]|nr:NFACT RNA binding domain-containing protein [Cyclobacteriaceae bacterium]